VPRKCPSAPCHDAAWLLAWLLLLLLPSPPPPTHTHTERSSERLLAAVQLGNASLALGAAEKMNGRLAEAESALRHGVSEMRWVLGLSAADLDKLRSTNVEVRGGGGGRWVCVCVGGGGFVREHTA
jgi:hypothetical protein